VKRHAALVAYYSGMQDPVVGPILDETRRRQPMTRRSRRVTRQFVQCRFPRAGAGPHPCMDRTWPIRRGNF
jgi:hypothetical protein